MAKDKKNIIMIKDEVLKEFPKAICRKRLTGERYYEIFACIDGMYLGQGKTKLAAWKSAYNNFK
jgi:hypothetical protein